jgi:hypothetical protein
MTRKFLHKTLVRNLDNFSAKGGKAGRMLFLTSFSAIARGAGRGKLAAEMSGKREGRQWGEGVEVGGTG